MEYTPRPAASGPGSSAGTAVGGGSSGCAGGSYLSKYGLCRKADDAGGLQVGLRPEAGHVWQGIHEEPALHELPRLRGRVEGRPANLG